MCGHSWTTSIWKHSNIQAKHFVKTLRLPVLNGGEPFGYTAQSNAQYTPQPLLKYAKSQDGDVAALADDTALKSYRKFCPFLPQGLAPFPAFRPVFVRLHYPLNKIGDQIGEQVFKNRSLMWLLFGW
jgi:hypothetical protein